MRITGVLLALSISTLLSAPMFADSNSEATVNGLSREFTEARSLPAGSRPPPPDGDLDYLKGARLSAIHRALGASDKPDHRWQPPECLAPVCLVWTYGPKEIPTTIEPSDRGDGTIEVIISTGGPYLLVLGFCENRVVNARWLGQK
jgi:hypothetical protein